MLAGCRERDEVRCHFGEETAIAETRGAHTPPAEWYTHTHARAHTAAPMGREARLCVPPRSYLSFFSSSFSDTSTTSTGSSGLSACSLAPLAFALRP